MTSAAEMAWRAKGRRQANRCRRLQFLARGGGGGLECLTSLPSRLLASSVWLLPALKLNTAHTSASRHSALLLDPSTADIKHSALIPLFAPRCSLPERPSLFDLCAALSSSSSRSPAMSGRQGQAASLLFLCRHLGARLPSTHSSTCSAFSSPSLSWQGQAAEEAQGG